ncbi:MAG: hypothetical protein HOL98_13855 [Gammaproteobacteria bacterium]|nr:hypothetical protein [Gammaproteobacteria bacterium]MBT5204537.1 hypothetical protein [Gammaproteobacteria bacterium]MBT5602332.1 hypothetical protein [Gammaproteobacteria bacterium]MBT6247245.1 hypothetical protein [Gammaproteobacteria bacterium]
MTDFKFISMVSIAFISLTVNADQQQANASPASANPISTQIQLCNLNPGKTMNDYDKIIQQYFKWSKKHDVEVVFTRNLPLFSHADASHPGYDFIEYLYSDYETSGNGWDKWLSTPDGQKLAAEWQATATCHVKMASLYVQHRDPRIMTDDDRVITQNWCTRNDGVSPDQLIAKHREVAENYPDDASNMAWAILYPQIGGAHAPGDFAHVNAYPDVAALMARQSWYNNDEGWRAIRDYNVSYASCRGESAFVEKVLHRPGS